MLCEKIEPLIITIGAKTGLPRRIEIWFTHVCVRIFICGTPDAKGGKGQYSPRDWLANLRANPDFTFCLKESLQIELPAKAVEIVDPEDRRYLMSAPETKWYRDQVDSVDDLVNYSPIVEVFLSGLAEWLTRRFIFFVFIQSCSVTINAFGYLE